MSVGRKCERRQLKIHGRVMSNLVLNFFSLFPNSLYRLKKTGKYEFVSHFYKILVESIARAVCRCRCQRFSRTWWTLLLADVVTLQFQVAIALVWAPFPCPHAVRLSRRFSTKESATHAIVSVHNSEINGQPVKCSWGKESGDPNNTPVTTQVMVGQNPARPP